MQLQNNSPMLKKDEALELINWLDDHANATKEKSKEFQMWSDEKRKYFEMWKHLRLAARELEKCYKKYGIL